MTRLVTVLTPLHEMASADLVQTLGELEALKAQVLGHLAPAPVAAPVASVERSSEWRLTAREVMARLNVSKSWLYRANHTLPFASQLGSRWRYSERGLAKYMRKRSVA